MPSKTVILGITVLAVVIIVGGATWTLLDLGKPATPDNPDNSLPDQTPSDQPEPENPEETPAFENSTDVPEGSSGATVEQARDAAMAYIKSTHSATAQFMTNLEWNGGRVEGEASEVETYIYYASEWTVKVEWSLVSDHTYNVSASHSLEENLILWEGTYKNGAIIETKYSVT